jgi:hypothetical protein
MKRFKFSSFAPIWIPAKIACKVDAGIDVAKTANATPILNRKPVLIIVADMPAAIPRLLTGHAFIIEAMFGATNNPAPMPTSIMGSTNTS